MQSPAKIWEQELLTLHARLASLFTIPARNNSVSPISVACSVILRFYRIKASSGNMLFFYGVT
ncbi:hypothetical protein [Xenorhabdus bovienii]|uniref:hypothetical protein n=1 Tax=Xenorhabdus bovienii TaxID=40576 RepID=UPI00056EB171|nr:hypothetical protein [Xenorhabdus bovienii]